MTNSTRLQQYRLKQQRKHGRYKRESMLALVLMTLPFCLLVFVYCYLPIAGMVLPFKDYNVRDGIFNSPWADPWYQNFKFLFGSPNTWKMLATTVLYSFRGLLTGIPIAVTVAVLLNEINSRRAVKAYQTFMTWPSYISAIVLSYIAYAVLNPRSGYLNQIITAFGGDPINVYNMSSPWFWITWIISIWASAGTSSMLYYATVIGIDPTYYEAAALDGASRWQKIRYIILPSLKPIICISLIMSVGGVLNSNFDLLYNLSMGSPYATNAMMVLDVYIYNGLTSSKMTLPAAADFFKSVVGFGLVLIANTVVKIVDPDNAMF